MDKILRMQRKLKIYKINLKNSSNDLEKTMILLKNLDKVLTKIQIKEI